MMFHLSAETDRSGRWPIVVGLLLLALCPTSLFAQDNPYRIDKDRAIFDRIEDDKRVASESQNPDEFAAYNEVLTFAHQFAAADLQSAARRDLGFKDLFHPIRKEFKLDLVYMEGRLQRLRSIGPNKPLKAAGIETLYEGWMFPKDQPNPVCILFTELPPGLTPQQDLAKDKLDRWVGFAGYSFKLLAYESAEVVPSDPMRGKMRKAPLLMGKSPTLLSGNPDPPGLAWHQTFLPVIMIGIGIMAVCVIGLGWWYRRGDEYLRQVVAERRDVNPF